MEFTIDFPGGARVDAHFGAHTIATDQPVKMGGADSAPSPFILFLASLGTCAGYYVLDFCRRRELPLDGVRVVQRVELDKSTGEVQEIGLEIRVPSSFPEKYLPALIRAADQCKVKKTIEHPPEIQTTVKVVEG